MDHIPNLSLPVPLVLIIIMKGGENVKNFTSLFMECIENSGDSILTTKIGVKSLLVVRVKDWVLKIEKVWNSSGEKRRDDNEGLDRFATAQKMWLGYVLFLSCTLKCCLCSQKTNHWTGLHNVVIEGK